MNDMKKEESAGTGPAELLSRLMDEPLGDFELRRLLTEVEKAPEGDLGRWRRYQAMRAVMRGEDPQQHAVDLSAAVREALAGEVVPVAVTADAANRRLGGWGGLAVAASVMFAAVLLVRSFDTGSGGDPLPVAQAPQAPAVQAPAVVTGSEPGGTPQATAVAVAPSQPEIIRGPDYVPQTARQPQPNVYLVRHAEYSSFAGSGAIMPYARVATSDAGN